MNCSGCSASAVIFAAFLPYAKSRIAKLRENVFDWFMNGGLVPVPQFRRRPWPSVLHDAYKKRASISPSA